MADVQIGIYALESLTTGMYDDHMMVYREYIQNSADALEEACRKGILDEKSMNISITIDRDDRNIYIEDNGTGIRKADVAKVLLSIGQSEKLNTESRGFRGIGRLGGISYCDTLVFTTSYKEEGDSSVVSFNCAKLRENLSEAAGKNPTIEDVFGSTVSVNYYREKKNKHYFKVSMLGVNLPELMDIEQVSNYISQVAPVAYQRNIFPFADKVHEYTKKYGYKVEELPISIRYEGDMPDQIYKPNKSEFISKNQTDTVTDLNMFPVYVDEELYAIGWYGECKWNGIIADDSISRIRLRKGNVQIGNSKVLDKTFKEARFNGYVQGELFVVTNKLVPNARRDNFEENSAYNKFIAVLNDGIPLFISGQIRQASANRNDVIKAAHKLLSELEEKQEKAALDEAQAGAYLEKFARQKTKLEKMKPVNKEDQEVRNALLEEVEARQKELEQIREVPAVPPVPAKFREPEAQYRSGEGKPAEEKPSGPSKVDEPKPEKKSPQVSPQMMSQIREVLNSYVTESVADLMADQIEQVIKNNLE